VRCETMTGCLSSDGHTCFGEGNVSVTAVMGEPQMSARKKATIGGIPTYSVLLPIDTLSSLTTQLLRRYCVATVVENSTIERRTVE
jgi:hypothetical protein